MANIFETDTVYTCREVAARLHLSEYTVRGMVFTNRIPSFKCGGGIRAARRFQGAELNDWLSRTNDSKPSASLAVRRPRIKGKSGAVKEFEDYVKELSK